MNCQDQQEKIRFQAQYFNMNEDYIVVEWNVLGSINGPRIHIDMNDNLCEVQNSRCFTDNTQQITMKTQLVSGREDEQG